MRKIPYVMDYLPEMEKTTLFGKDILSYKKKELAAYIIFLVKNYNEMLDEKNRQIRNIISLRRQ